MRRLNSQQSATSDDALIAVAYDLLATYRLTTLIKDDKITEDFRHLIFDRFGEPTEEDSHKISYLMSCPWCLGMYFAGMAVLCRGRWPRLWAPVAKGLAFSALTGLLAEARTRAQVEAA